MAKGRSWMQADPDTSGKPVDRILRAHDEYMDLWGMDERLAQPSSEAEKDPRRKKLSHELFQQAPDTSLYRMSELRSFAVLGIDLKITPENDVKVIEVNGINSGTDGFARAGAGFTETSRRMYNHQMLEDMIQHWFSNFIPVPANPCEDALKSYIKGLGNGPCAYIAARLRLAGMSDSRFEGADMILRDKLDFGMLSPVKKNALDGLHPGWKQRYGEIADILIGVEETLENKTRTDSCFRDLRKIKDTTFSMTNADREKMIAEYEPSLVVVKPENEMQGYGVEIQRLCNLESRDCPGMVVEPFVYSKPIIAEKDGKPHDGCMRYVITIEEDRLTGDINIDHFGGYWRLCPDPMNGRYNAGNARANLSQGAIAQKASSEDLELVRKTVDEHFAVFYRNLVRKSRA